MNSTPGAIEGALNIGAHQDKVTSLSVEPLHDCGEHDEGFVASASCPTVEELLAMEATVPPRWGRWVVYRGMLEQGLLQLPTHERRGELERSFQQTDWSAIA